MFPLLPIVFRSLLRHRRRSFIIGGALALACGLITLAAGLAQGAREQMNAITSTLLSSDVNVSGIYKLGRGHATPQISIPAGLEDRLLKWEPQARITERDLGIATVSSETDSLSSETITLGVDWDQDADLRQNLVLELGRGADLRQPGTILLFQDQAKKLGVTVGDVVTVSGYTQQGVRNALDVRVVGVADNQGSMVSGMHVILPRATVRSLFQYGPQSVGVFRVKLPAPVDEEARRAAQQRIEQALRQEGQTLLDYEAAPWPEHKIEAEGEAWTGQRLSVTTLEDEISIIGQTLTAVDVLTGILAGVLFLLVSLGLANGMWLAVNERTREIGTMRAIGMSRGAVGRMFLLEGLLLGAVGGAAGILGGALLCEVVNLLRIAAPGGLQVALGAGELLHLSPPSPFLFKAYLGLVACTTLMSVAPARRAAKLLPLTAMQDLGGYR